MQMIVRFLLSTNFNTLQSHLQGKYNGQSIDLTTPRLGVQMPAEVGNILIFKTIACKNCQLATNFNLENL